MGGKRRGNVFDAKNKLSLYTRKTHYFYPKTRVLGFFGNTSGREVKIRLCFTKKDGDHSEEMVFKK